MTLVFYKASAAALIFLISLATAVFPIRKKTRPHAEPRELGESFASGIFLGAAFFHMLPDAIQSYGRLYGAPVYPLPEGVCVLGFLLLLLLERLARAQAANTLPYMIGIILIVHAIAEGIALGLGISFSEAFLIFIAILVHKASESFALSITLLRHQVTKSHIMVIIIIFALMTPLGIFLGTTVSELAFVRSGELAFALFNAFTAGTFLYISTLHHKHTKTVPQLGDFFSLVIGCALMGVIALWA